ncbi:MAG: HAMP domain-containing protein [Anaerolineae bacterium]|nr:HAMP domain-containing protein [Gemmatimonadaceae bacterium]
MTATPQLTSAAVPKAMRAVSLRTELLVNLTMLATATLMLVVGSFVAFGHLLDSADASLYLTAMIVADVAVFVAFGAYQIRRLILKPVEDIVAATDEIAAGDLARRVPAGKSPELVRLANAINWMTNRLLEERSHLVRVEKMASIGRLAAGVAHEIGNPIAAISGYTDTLRRRAGGSGEVEGALDGIERESARIDRIVRGLLDYARPAPRSRHAIDLSDTASRVVDLLRGQGALRDARVSLELASGLPAVYGDRNEMEQALVNLLLNAADAAPAGGEVNVVTRRAALSEIVAEKKQRSGDSNEVDVPRAPNARLHTWLSAAGHPKEMLQIIVSDSGPGVADEDKERIFDPFFTTKDPGMGTGLGLAIVARLVENLGGAIWVRRAREGGAAFVMLFPILPENARPGVASVALARSGA